MNLNDAALAYARASLRLTSSRIAGGTDGREDTRPELHRAAAVFLTVDFVSARPGVKVERRPDFDTSVMRIARSRAYPAPQ